MDNEEQKLNEIIDRIEVCPVCKAVTNGDRFCHNCGKNLLNDNYTEEEKVEEEAQEEDIKVHKRRKLTPVQVILMSVSLGIFLIVIALIPVYVDRKNEGSPTLSNYYKIENGMSYDRVINILGNPYGTEQAYGYVLCSWFPKDNYGNTLALVTVGFTDGKVSDKNWIEWGTGNSY